MKLSERNKFFKLLHKAIGKSEQLSREKQEKSDSYSGKRTRPRNSGDTSEKQRGKSH